MIVLFKIYAPSEEKTSRLISEKGTRVRNCIQLSLTFKVKKQNDLGGEKKKNAYQGEAPGYINISECYEGFSIPPNAL